MPTTPSFVWTWSALGIRDLAQLPEQIANDRFGLKLVARPAFFSRAPCLLAGVERGAFLHKFGVALSQPEFLLCQPVGQAASLGVQFLALFLLAGVQRFQFMPLLQQGVSRVPVMLGQDIAGFFNALSRSFGTVGMRNLRESLFHRQPHFERLAVRFLQLPAQPVQTDSTGFEVVGVQTEHVLLSADVGALRLTLLFPRGLLSAQIFTFSPQAFLLRPPRFEQRLAFAIDRLFALFEQVHGAGQLPIAQQLLGGQILKPAFLDLLLAPKCRLICFEVVAQSLQMILLESHAVFKQRALLAKFTFLPRVFFLLLELLLFKPAFLCCHFGRELDAQAFGLFTHRLTQLFDFGRLAVPFGVELGQADVALGPPCGALLLQFQLLPRMLERHILPLAFDVASGLAALGLEGMAFAHQGLVQVLKFLGALAGGPRTFGEFGLAAGQPRFTFVQLGFEFCGPHPNCAPFLVKLRQLRTEAKLAAVEFDVLSPQMLGELPCLDQQLIVREIARRPRFRRLPDFVGRSLARQYRRGAANAFERDAAARRVVDLVRLVDSQP